ncbi:MAG: hypothetical protein GX543_06585 [Gordonia sp.]|nr:hypothetical protein [Gordonia sp. (in: high G+C Gram-positive bacteria)]
MQIEFRGVGVQEVHDHTLPDEGVRATGADGRCGRRYRAPAAFSLRGPWIGVAAPGTDIVSLAPGEGRARLIGGGIINLVAAPRPPRSRAKTRTTATAWLVRRRR